MPTSPWAKRRSWAAPSSTRQGSKTGAKQMLWLHSVLQESSQILANGGAAARRGQALQAFNRDLTRRGLPWSRTHAPGCPQT